MNIFPLTQAEQALREAHFFTADGTDRNEIAEEHERVLKLLRKRCVFMGSLPGTEPVPKADGEADGVPWCAPCQSWHNKPKNREHHAALKCCAPWIEPAPKAASQETSAPNSLTPDPACPHCHGTGVGAGGVFTNCICTYGESTQPPIMDEDDLRRDLQRLCQEQRQAITDLIGKLGSTRQLCHRAAVRLEAGTNGERLLNAPLAKELREASKHLREA